MSTPLSPADLARRFDEPLPRRPAARGRGAGAARTRRPARLQPPHPPALDGAPGVGAAPRRRLDRGADRPRSTSRAPCGRCRRSAPSSRRRSCAGCATWPASARTPAAPSRRAAPRRRSPGCSRRGRRRSPTSGRAASARTRPVVVCGEHAHYGVARAIGELGLGTDRDGRRPVARTSGWTSTRSSGELGPPRARRPPGHGRRRHRRHDRHRVVRRPRGDRAAVRARTASGCTWTAPTAPRRCCRRRTATASAGIHRARSIAWDPHKMMLMPLTASVVLVRDEADLEAAFSQRAPYLFHARPRRAALGPGPAQLHVLAPHRRVQGLGRAPAPRRERAGGALRPPVRQRPHAPRPDPRRAATSRPSTSRESNILCFRYVGDGARGRRSPRRRQPAGARARTTARGTGWITTTMLGGRRVLRATLMNPRTTARDLEATLEDLAQIAGHALAMSDGRRSPGHPSPLTLDSAEPSILIRWTFVEAFGVDRAPRGQVRTCGAWFCIRPTALLARSRRRALPRTAEACGADVGRDGRQRLVTLGRGRTGGVGRRERSRRRGGRCRKPARRRQGPPGVTKRREPSAELGPRHAADQPPERWFSRAPRASGGRRRPADRALRGDRSTSWPAPVRRARGCRGRAPRRRVSSLRRTRSGACVRSVRPSRSSAVARPPRWRFPGSAGTAPAWCACSRTTSTVFVSAR